MSGRRATLSPVSSSRRMTLTTKVINHGEANDLISETLRSKSTPARKSQPNFVGGNMGNLPYRIHGTSNLPVASIQATQAQKVQELIREKLNKSPRNSDTIFTYVSG